MGKVVLIFIVLPAILFSISIKVESGIFYTLSEGDHDLDLSVVKPGVYVIYTRDGILEMDGERIEGLGVFNFVKDSYSAKFLSRSDESVLGFIGVETSLKIPGNYKGSLAKIGNDYLGVYRLVSDFESEFKMIYRSSYTVSLRIFSMEGKLLSEEKGDGFVSLNIPRGREFILVIDAHYPSFEIEIGVLKMVDLKELLPIARGRCSSYKSVYRFRSEWNVSMTSKSPATSCWRIVADSFDVYSVKIESKNPVGMALYNGEELLSFSQGIGEVKLSQKLRPGSYDLVVFSPSESLSFDVVFSKKPRIFKVKEPFAYTEVFRNGGARKFDVSIRDTATYLLRVEGNSVSVWIETRDSSVSYENVSGGVDVGLFLEKGEEATMTIEAGPNGKVERVSFKEVLNPNFDIKMDFVCDGFESRLNLKFPKEVYRYFKNSGKPLKAENYVKLLDDDFAKSVALYIARNCSDVYDALVSLVQKLEYMKDEYYGNYPKYPSETLVEGGGDCEDKSILLASMLRYLGYDVVLIELPDHMAVGVASIEPEGEGCFSFSGKEYCYQETTSEGWKPGMIPPEFSGRSVRIIKVPEVSE